MSKGTKQVRIGRLIKTVKNMQDRLEILQATVKSLSPGSVSHSVLVGKIEELDYCIFTLCDVYDLDIE